MPDVAMQLIAITPPYFYANEAVAIANAIADGFNRVHIRKPGSTIEQMKHLLEAIPPELRRYISLHDHTMLAKSYGIGGVHLNSRNTAVPEGFNGIVSCSAHTPDEARQATADYVLLSPIFPSFSKPGYTSHYSFEEMAAAASPRVIALGGVARTDLMTLEKAGFGGAAMLTEAWRKPMDMHAFRLQFITHPTPARNVVEGALMALEGGCRWLQLRHKDADIDTLINEGTHIAEMCHKYGATFIVDDHVELVDRLDADGVHLGQNDMPVNQARRILGPSKIIGATANTYSMLFEAARAGADYAGVGPFRFTTTKTNLSPVLGLQGYSEITKCCNHDGVRIPIVAIGGITPNDIPEIMQTGVDGIAASSTILNAANPIIATTNILNSLENNKQ